MIYYDENENMFDPDELGIIDGLKKQIAEKANAEISQITFIGKDDITDEYVYRCNGHDYTMPCMDDSYAGILSYVQNTKSETEVKRDTIKRKCDGCYRGNYMTCNQATNPRCLKGSLDECEGQIERLQMIIDYMEKNPSFKYTTDGSHSMYTEIYIKYPSIEKECYEAKFDSNEHIWKVANSKCNISKHVGVSTGIESEVADFYHSKQSGDTDIVRSLDKEQIQMTVNYLNTGYTIICRNCGKVTFFDKEYLNSLKVRGRTNLPVRCSACKERLIRQNQ